MSDPFVKAARRIFAHMAKACVLTRAADSEEVTTTAVLDLDVEIVDDLGAVVDRDDMISLLNEDVGLAKSADTVTFDDTGHVYRLGRKFKDDGEVTTLVARRV